MPYIPEIPSAHHVANLAAGGCHVSLLRTVVGSKQQELEQLFAPGAPTYKLS